MEDLTPRQRSSHTAALIGAVAAILAAVIGATALLINGNREREVLAQQNQQLQANLIARSRELSQLQSPQNMPGTEASTPSKSPSTGSRSRSPVTSTKDRIVSEPSSGRAAAPVGIDTSTDSKALIRTAQPTSESNSSKSDVPPPIHHISEPPRPVTVEEGEYQGTVVQCGNASQPFYNGKVCVEVERGKVIQARFDNNSQLWPPNAPYAVFQNQLAVGDRVSVFVRNEHAFKIVVARPRLP
jgi:cytoskeletal protein RodZ